MENRFESKNDYYEVIGGDDESKALRLSMEFFREEAKGITPSGK